MAKAGYFGKLAALNKTVKRTGGTEFTPVSYIKKSFDIAVDDTDNRLKRQSDVVAKRKAK